MDLELELELELELVVLASSIVPKLEGVDSEAQVEGCCLVQMLQEFQLVASFFSEDASLPVQISSSASVPGLDSSGLCLVVGLD